MPTHIFSFWKYMSWFRAKHPQKHPWKGEHTKNITCFLLSQVRFLMQKQARHKKQARQRTGKGSSSACFGSCWYSSLLCWFSRVHMYMYLQHMRVSHNTYVIWCIYIFNISIYIILYLYLCIPIYLYLYLYIQSINQSINQSIYLSIYLSIYVYIYIYTYTRIYMLEHKYMNKYMLHMIFRLVGT